MVIVVEHNIEQVAPLSDLMVLMYDGNIAKAAPPSEFFENSEFLLEHGIIPPQSTAFIDQLKKANLYQGVLPVALEDAVAISTGVLDTPAQNNGKDAG